MTIHKTEAIVFERRDYRETSYLLSFFTPDFGKIHAQAKGARRKIDKFGSSFLPISYNTIIFYENTKSDLHIISQADMIEHFEGIGNNIEKFTYAAYFMELINTAMPLGEKNREIFSLMMNFLKFLDKEDTISNIRQIFEIKFLNLSGFKPRLDCCVRCASHILEKSKFSYCMGGLLCPKCFTFDARARDVMKGTIATVNHIEEMNLKENANFKIISSVKTELEEILKNFIDFHLGTQFKSLEFFKKVRFPNV